MGPAIADLRASYPTNVSDKTVTYCLWVVNNGAGILTDDQVILFARRAVLNKDFEYEEYRFKSAVEEVIDQVKKGKTTASFPESMGRAPLAAAAILDACCGGCGGKEEFSEEIKGLVRVVAEGAFPQVTAES